MSALLDQLRHGKLLRYFLGLSALIVLLMVLNHFAEDTRIEKYKRVRTKTILSGLLQTVEGFHSIYGRLPACVPPGGELAMNGQAATTLLTVLLGKEPVGSPMDNRKQIRFLNIEETKRRERGGLLYPPDHDDLPPVGIYDPWGNPFHLRFAPKDGSGIQDPFQPDQRIQGKAVIVFSYGPNGKPDAKDDLKSW
ncbi:hypothetical protein [Luteolibacter sp. Populi]|uniref:hypothetical protein n=1 Tax=Luteolibacter sp. Populi TaxID=3230487 RepID=UPI003467063A